MIKTIIFDLDGVLWNLDFIELGNLIANELQVEDNLIEEFAKDMENMISILLHKTNEFITKDVILNTIEQEISLDKYKVLKEDIYKELLNENYNYCHNNIDALPVIKELYNRGYNLVVKTNWFQSIQIKNLNRYGYLPYFTKVVGILDSYLKPNPLSVKELITQDISEYIIVGDSLRKEIQLANNLGMKSIWLNETKKEKPTDSNYQPTYEIKDIKELLEIL